MNIKLVAVAAIALALGTWLLVRGDAVPVAAVPPPSMAASTETVGSDRGQAIDGDSTLAGQRQDLPAVADTALTENEPLELALKGRVVIVDPEGREHDRLDGTIDFVVALDPQTAEQRTVRFSAGTFELELPAGALFQTATLTAQGRPAVTDREWLEAAHGLAIELRGVWQPDSLLRVVDRATGQELDGVDVKRRWSWRAIGDAIHPGDAPEVEVVARAATSPVTLPAMPRNMRTVAYWARAPGYAWQRIDIDHAVGGERVVELDPGGELVVATAGALPPGERFVRVFAPSRMKMSWHALAELRLEDAGPLRVSDLQPGNYVVRVDCGAYAETLPLGRSEAEVRPGEVTHVTVPVTAVEVETARLFGTLDFPAGFDVGASALGPNALIVAPYPWNSLPGQGRVLVRFDQLRADEHVPGRFFWDVGRVQRGLYLATVSAVMHRILVDVDALQEQPCAIVVPALATLAVDVVDAATNEPLEAQVTWADGPIEGVNENSIAQVPPDDDGKFRIHSVVGTIRVGAALEAYGSVERDVDLTGDGVLTLRLDRASGMRIGYWEGEARLPIAMDLGRPRLVDPESGADVVDGVTARTDALECRLDVRPGVYELHFRRTPSGYAPIEPLVVEVPLGERVDVKVELVRSE